MKKISSVLALLAIAAAAQAQNIGINTTGAVPAASSILDLVSADKGLLVPRIVLTATNVAAPVVLPATSLLVYNTNTAGVPPNNVTPGYYYWDGAAWVRVGAANAGWTITGNTGTVAATNFLGTTDLIDFVIRTNNTERLRVLGGTGRVGWGTTTPIAPLEVNSAAGDAIFGHSTNVGGWLGRETNITLGVPPQTLQGAGVYASNPTAGYTSTYAQSTGAATVAAAIAYSDVWFAQYNYVQNATAGFNPSGSYSQLNVTNAALGGLQSAHRTWSDRGTTAGNIGWTLGGQYTGVSQNQDAIGVWGTAISNSAFERTGGYFESDQYNLPGNYLYAWVGGVVAGVNRKITGIGSVAEIVPTENHGRVSLVCPESPEYWYQDYGTVQLVNGVAHVELDPILADIIVVDAAHPVRVFCTPVDMLNFNGVAITARTATGFDLVELNGGAHTGTLDYQLIAKPKTNLGEGRFVQAPGPAWLKPSMEPAKAKAANRPDPSSIYHWPSDWEVYGYDVEKVTPIGGTVMAGEHKGMVKVAEGVFAHGMPAQKPKTD
ncbi:MAG: hypothetical protein ABI599_17050 [Flavobacteriales bacterium]